MQNEKYIVQNVGAAAQVTIPVNQILSASALANVNISVRGSIRSSLINGVIAVCNSSVSPPTSVMQQCVELVRAAISGPREEMLLNSQVRELSPLYLFELHHF